MSFGYAVYFTERAKNRVIRWHPDTGDTDIVAGEPPGGEEDQFLNSPYGLVFDPGGSLLIADKLNHRICKLSNGRLEALVLKDLQGTRAPRADSPFGYSPELRCPTGLFVEKAGSLLCTFADDYTIYRIQPNGEIELVLGIPPNRNYLRHALCEQVPVEDLPVTPLGVPTGIVFRQRTEQMVFIERIHQTVRVLERGGELRCIFPYGVYWDHSRRTVAPTHSAMTDYHPAFPGCLALDQDDVLFMTEVLHGCVLKVDLDKREVRKVIEVRKSKSEPNLGVAAMTFGPDGTAWIMNSAELAIEAYAPTQQGTWMPLANRLTHFRGQGLVLPQAGSGLTTGR